MKEITGVHWLTTIILIIVGFCLMFYGIDSRIRSIEKRLNDIDTVEVVNNHYSDSTVIIERFLEKHTDTTIYIFEFTRDSLFFYKDTCQRVPEYRYIVKENILIACDTSKAIDEAFKNWFKRFEQTLDSLLKRK